MRSLIVLLLLLDCYPACADDKAPDENYQPLFRLVPTCQKALWQRRIEGVIDLAFTVNADRIAVPIENVKARVVFPLGK